MIFPVSDYTHGVFMVSGILISLTYGNQRVFPTAYLKSDIKLLGSGTSENPYEIIG